MNLSPKTRALIARTLLGLLLAELPLATIELSKPNPDYRVLALGLLGGLAAYLDKQFSPQLADVILPGALVAVPGRAPGVIVDVVNPPPPTMPPAA
jgi:hypothetical protein